MRPLAAKKTNSSPTVSNNRAERAVDGDSVKIRMSRKKNTAVRPTIFLARSERETGELLGLRERLVVMG